MSQSNRFAKKIAVMLCATIAGFSLLGCQSHSGKMEMEKSADARPTIRINAGATATYTDSNGHVWMADQGFEGGDVVTRDDDVKIINTKDPVIYRNEHYGMNAFSQKVPNGKYTVKLHFCETFEENTTAGSRVFSFNVEGHEFKDFDLFAKAGGAMRPYIQTVDVEINDGKLDITFTPNAGDPEINGIEIIPN